MTSRSKAKTKRRKVFVNEYSDGLLLLAAKLSRKEALDGRGCNARTVCFVEARPGDVVLSREDRDAVLSEVHRLMDSAEAWRSMTPLLRLLRGGR